MAAVITADMVKELRSRTGIGVGKCKEALREADGDIDLAVKNLRKAGMASAVKKEGRETREGVIAAHESNDAIALVEINAETDFVVRNDKFQKFASEIAQLAAESKPESLEAFVAGPSPESGMSIDEYRATVIQSLGENIQIKRVVAIPKAADASYGLYSHMGGQIVCLVEISGGTDQGELARQIGMHVAAEAPEYLSPEDVPESVKQHEEEIARSQVQGKPENVIDKIVQGKIGAYMKQVCLLNQPYIREPKQTVAQVVEAAGKGLKLTRFARWSVGQ
jgi:elongation factor Ts